MWRARNQRPDPATRPARFEALNTAALVTDLAALRSTLIGHFRRLATCQTVVLCAFDPGRDAYLPAASSHAIQSSGAPVEFPAGGHLIQWLEVNDTYLPIPDDDGVFNYLTAGEQRGLHALDVRLCMPLLAGGHVVSLLLFVDKRPGWRLPAPDASVVFQHAGYAAIVCERAERHRADHERLEVKHQAQQLVVAGQLAAAVAHEVRNPLSSIRSTIQYVLTSGSEWENKRELLRDTLHEVDRIEQSVAGMLSLSRPRNLTLVVLDITEVARESLRLVQAYAETQRILLRSDSGQPIMVTGDRKELRQVFVNLLLNACQAMPNGGTITLTSDVGDDRPEPLATTQRYGIIRVADTGPGIPQDQMARVFDPFFTTKASGTGLGLPICLEIVSRHDGRLLLTCPPTGGTVAAVWLPVEAT
jgi:signal transduction histidine kinase